jgi:YD repeat-containing protein
MKSWKGLHVWAIVAIAAMAAQCGKNNSTSPTSPGAGGGGTTTCRTYATAATVTTTVSTSGIVFNGSEAATFDSSSRQATVRTNFANGAPCNTAVSSYNSVADFVDEVHVIPPVNYQTGSTSTNSGACGNVTGSNTFTYDGQRRLVSITPNVGSPTTYTAWDSSGRPTAGSSGGQSITFVYNDSARSFTSTLPGNVVSTMTFDANGIPTSSVVASGGITTTTTFVTTSTAQVCK